ncbi:PASTA domain-containing protein [Streptomyces sp. NPDC004788]
MRTIRRTAGVAVLSAALLAGLTACAASKSDADATPEPATSAPTAPANMAQGDGEFMADLRGGSVESAMGQLTATMQVEDVSGQGREVPMNATDWKICTQDPAPGARIESGKTIVLGAVKKDENC